VADVWESEVVRYEVDDGVAWLTIDRPEARNALSQAVRDGLWPGASRATIRRPCSC